MVSLAVSKSEAYESITRITYPRNLSMINFLGIIFHLLLIRVDLYVTRKLPVVVGTIGNLITSRDWSKQSRDGKMIFILTELGLIHIFRTFNPFDNHIRRHLAIHFLCYGFEDHLSRDLDF